MATLDQTVLTPPVYNPNSIPKGDPNAVGGALPVATSAPVAAPTPAPVPVSTTNTYDPIKKYLTDKGQDFSMDNIKALAAEKGMTTYTGSDEENKNLAGLLTSSASSTSTQKTAPSSTPANTDPAIPANTTPIFGTLNGVGNQIVGYTQNGQSVYFRQSGSTPAVTPAVTPATVAGAETTLTAPKSATDYQTEAYKSLYPEYSGAIDAITQDFTRQIQDAQNQGQRQQGANRAQGAAFGLMGSPDQQSNTNSIAASTEKAVSSLNTAKLGAITDVITKINTNAAALGKAQAEQDMTSASNILKLRDQLKQDAQASIETLAKNGVTAAELKDKDPETYNQLLQHSGVDENTLSAMFAGSIPVGNVLQRWSTGKMQYQLVQVPGQAPKVMSYDVGVEVPPEWKTSIDGKGNFVAYDPTNPSKIITKQLAGNYSTGISGVSSGLVSDALKEGISKGIYDPNKINSRTLGIYNDLANARVNAAGAHADITAKTKAFEDAVQYSSIAQRTSSVLDKNMPLLEGLADKVNTSGVPGIDRIVAGAQAYTGNNPDVIKYVNTIKTLRSEYANLLAKGNAVTESMRADAEEAIPTGLTSAGYQALAQQLQLETSNIIQAANDSAKAVVPGQGEIGIPETRSFDGHTYKKVDGGWQLVQQ